MPNNKELSYSYDNHGNVISVLDSDNNLTAYIYDDMNQLIKEIDANGNVVEYEYSDFGRIQKKIFEDGTYTFSTYDANDNLLEYIDELGNKQIYSYNAIGLLTMVKDNAGNMTTYEYDCMNNVSKIIQPDGSFCSYDYDINNNLVQITDEEGYLKKYKYDANGNIIEEIDGNNNITRYSYDALNRIVAITDSKGNVTTKEYSPNSNLLSVIDANGNSRRYEYNKNNQVIKFMNEANEEEIYCYDVMGYLAAVTDANGYITKYEYDGSGNITKILYPNGSDVNIEYDGVGNMISYTEPNGAQTKYLYDKKNRLLSEQYVNGTSKNYKYDAIGNQISLIDENGNETRYIYDCLHRIIKVINATGSATEYSYDVRSNLLAVTQYSQVQEEVINSMKKGKGTSYENTVKEIITRYEYDRKNQVLKEISPTGKITSYTYDANGNMICKVDSDQIVTDYVYDAMNNLIKIQFGDEKEVSYKYNAINCVVGMTDWNGTSTYELDQLGRILSVTDYQNKKIKYTWNSNGEKSRLVYPDGSTISYEYDNMNQLVRVDDSVNGMTDYKYDINGNLVEVSFPNGTKTINEYDNMSRLIRKLDYDSTNSIVDDFIYEYDGVGNKISIRRDKKLNNSEKILDESNGTTKYQYNSLNQLISQIDNKNMIEKYFYDTLGNRIRKEIWMGNMFCLTASDYSYNGDNQLESVTGKLEEVYGTLAIRPVTMQYDGRGNLVKVSQNQKDIASFCYDKTNSLIQSTDSIGIRTEYRYDGNGTRISKTTSVSGELSNLTSKAKEKINKKLQSLSPDVAIKLDNYVANYYINDITSDYNEVLLSYSNCNKNLRYTYGLDILSATSFDCGEVDWTEERSFSYDKKNSVFYFVDEQGTPVKLTNKKGCVTEKFSYDEYGNPSVETHLSSYIGMNNIVGYAGYQYDRESGLYYVQARYYNPNTSSFISKDVFRGSVSDGLSLNRYAYCCGNPITYVDPSGYYTTLEGYYAHRTLQYYFLSFYNNQSGSYPEMEYNVYGIENNKSFWGRADMVLINKWNREVYEIKPFPDRYMGTGRQQLQGYVNAMNTYGVVTAVKGTSFLPVANGLKIPYPLDSRRTITYYTYHDDPGMIYYNISPIKKLERDYVPAVINEKDESETNLQTLCEGVLVTGGTVAVGYVVYRVVRLAPSLFPIGWWSLPANLIVP